MLVSNFFPFHRLHGILGATGPGTSRPPTEGILIGALVLNYADGERQECEIRYGRHVRDWWTCNDSRNDTDLGKVAWYKETPASMEMWTDLRLYHCTWENPRPDVEVVSIDFVSKMTSTAPFIIGLTVE